VLPDEKRRAFEQTVLHKLSLSSLVALAQCGKNAQRADDGPKIA
jgi:hypothetical protein